MSPEESQHLKIGQRVSKKESDTDLGTVVSAAIPTYRRPVFVPQRARARARSPTAEQGFVGYRYPDGGNCDDSREDDNHRQNVASDTSRFYVRELLPLSDSRMLGCPA